MPLSFASFRDQSALAFLFSQDFVHLTAWGNSLDKQFLVTTSTLPFVRPTNVVQSFLHPFSSHDQFAHHIAGLVGSTTRWSFFAAWLDWLQPNSFLQFLTLVLGCPCLPKDLPGLRQMHLFHTLRPNHSRVHRHVPLKKSKCAENTSPAHERSSRCSHLFPPASFKDLLPASLQLLFSTFSHPDMVDNSSSISKSFTSMKKK